MMVAKRLEDTTEEKKIQEIKHNSILLNSTLDFMKFQRDKKGQKTNIFLESNTSKRKISALLKNLKGERSSMDFQPRHINKLSIDSPFIPFQRENAEAIVNEDLNKNDLQKPIFLYLPHEEELKEMIFGVLKVIAQDEEYFKSIKLPKRRKK